MWPPPGARPALRLSLGVGAATVFALGRQFPLAYIYILLTALVLSPSTPPPGPRPTLILFMLLGVASVFGLVLGPALIHAPAAGVLAMVAGVAAGTILSLRPATAMVGSIVILASTLIGIAASISSALAVIVVQAMVGAMVAALVIAQIAHALLPGPPARPGPAAPAGAQSSGWIVLRSSLIMLPPILLALINPAQYLALLMKGATLSQQSEITQIRAMGRELVLSTVVGVGVSLVVWFALKPWPNLAILALLLMATTLLMARKMYGLSPSGAGFAFWSNALMTVLILIGPALQSTSSPEEVLSKMMSRALTFLALAIYSVGAVWLVEALRPKALAERPASDQRL
jgi:hypothetical protein